MLKNYLLFYLAFFIIQVNAQTTVGLLQHTDQSIDNGYVLFSPISSKKTYLINKCGQEIKQWTSLYNPGQSVYLLEDGTILRPGKINNSTFTAGGNGGVIEKFDWDGNLIWRYAFSDGDKCQHHDVRQMPNGNVLIISWERKTSAEAIAQGRNPSLTTANVWSEQIVELQPVGITEANVVWEWHAWDHLVQEFDTSKPNYAVVSENPNLINMNYRALANTEDWLHINSIDYNADLDQIMLSTHSFSELWIIDHSTSSAEAASHTGGNSGRGGDLLYRWGNSLAYNQGSPSDRKFWGQHNAHWIDSTLPFGNQIMVFNNGTGRIGGSYSTVEIINPPVQGFGYSQTLPFGPSDQSWIYNEGNIHAYYAQNISGSQQLSNGNVLICNGPEGRFTEVDTGGNTVWEYVNAIGNGGIANQGTIATGNLVFRCGFYPSNYLGLSNQTLTVGNIIENSNTLSELCNLTLAAENNEDDSRLEVYPNPANANIYIQTKNQEVITKLELFTFDGKLVFQESVSINQLNPIIPITSITNGLYFLRVTLIDQVFLSKIVIQH